MKIKEKLTRTLLHWTSFAIGLLSTAIIAFAVTGTINTFSSGQAVNPSSLNTNFQTIKTAIESIPTEKSWRLIYENNITGSTGSVNVTGLDGNAEVEYMVIANFIGAAGATAAGNYMMEINNDAVACNYKFHHYYVHHGTAASSISFGAPTCPANAGLVLSASAATGSNNGVAFTGKVFLLSKSGTKRVALSEGSKALSTSDAWTMNALQWWEDTSSNITSMRFYFSNGTGIGVGSRIEIWARR